MQLDTREREIHDVNVDLTEMSQDEKKMLERLREIRERNERGQLPSLRGIDRWKLRTIT